MKLKVCTTQQGLSVPSAYVDWYRHNPDLIFHPDISPPAEQMVELADRVMLRIQAALPLVSWERIDKGMTHTTSLRWYGPDSQLQLTLRLGREGFSVSLYPDFCSGDGLVYWSVFRTSRPFWEQSDYGKLDIYRLDRSAVMARSTRLKFDDPVFAGVPRMEARHYPDKYRQPANLVDDIIAVTKERLKALAA